MAPRPVPPPPPPHTRSVWDRLICGPHCLDVAKCCGEGEAIGQPDDCGSLDDELVSIVQYDEPTHSGKLRTSEPLPTLIGRTQGDEPEAGSLAFEVGASGLPWADLKGPRKWGGGDPPRSTSSGSSEASFPAQLRTASAADASASHARRRARSPSINPYSKYGFITITVPANCYLADASDPMDVEFARHLLALDAETAAALELRRLAHGKYEVHGRCVAVRRGGGCGCGGLLAREDPLMQPHGASDVQATEYDEEVPLGEYLRQIADIAASLRPTADHRLLTFVDPGERAAGDRFESMRIACEQARLRAQAAETCRSGGRPLERCATPATSASTSWSSFESRPQVMPVVLPGAPLTFGARLV